jgi:hypothetical protein
MPHQPIPPKQPPGEPTEELLAILAHELRRPLTAMLGALATLQHRQQALPVLQQQELVGIARRQGEQLGRLLDQVLAATGMDRGRTVVARRSLVDVAAVAEEAGQVAQLAHPDHPITIEVAGPLLVRVDPLAVSRILATCSTTPPPTPRRAHRSGCRPAGTARTHCWPSKTRGPGSRRMSASGSSSGTPAWPSRPPAPVAGWGSACTSPAGSPAPTKASCRPPTRQATWVLGWSSASHWRRQPPAAADPQSGFGEAPKRPPPPNVRSDSTKVWSLLLLERQLRPEAFGRRRGGYLDRRRTPPTR